MSTADIAAVAIFTVWAVFTLGVRVFIHYRQTGTTGLHGISATASPAEVAAGLLISASTFALFISPFLELFWSLPSVLAAGAARWAGLVVALFGMVITFVAQIAMGRSWRVGVDPQEKTELVTGGPFSIVRNPIFSAMIFTALGLTLLVDNVVAAAAFLGLTVAVEIQVRAVEEPYLMKVHGRTYGDYTRRVGRFLPSIGRRRTIKKDG
ncbi:MAG TPA: isoprenylcysteine carboxylmethyltransferase family protein [Actinomycetota bacterium]|nr:isoprenylcysteine carboxylmethyltransferase family protein [Actinomycetota bacterium]